MDVLLFPLRVVALVGFLALVVGVVYLATQVLIYLVLKYEADGAYRLWLLPLGDFRTLVTLPMLSAIVAILASAGVNLVTQHGSQEDLLSGMQLILLGVLTLLLFGFTLAASYRPQSSARALARRLNKIAAGVDDPFASLESARRLRDEIYRHAKSGERHQGLAASMNFRHWVHNNLNDKGSGTLIIAAYAAPIAAIVVVVGKLFRVGFRQEVPPFVSWFLVVGCFGGLIAPIFHFSNQRKRRELFGRFLANESHLILVKIDRLNRWNEGLRVECPNCDVSASRKRRARARSRSMGGRSRRKR
ncbi:hypothetical protein AB0B48_01995 [Micromonospora sp. NPDC049089]|uniref:hypothetical protein n=1 Tax=Micromonospora sp. NPDC049089 TaxID=3155496 RepID=UPI0033FDA5D0